MMRIAAFLVLAVLSVLTLADEEKCAPVFPYQRFVSSLDGSNLPNPNTHCGAYPTWPDIGWMSGLPCISVLFDMSNYTLPYAIATHSLRRIPECLVPGKPATLMRKGFQSVINYDPVPLPPPSPPPSPGREVPFEDFAYEELANEDFDYEDFAQFADRDPDSLFNDTGVFIDLDGDVNSSSIPVVFLGPGNDLVLPTGATLYWEMVDDSTGDSLFPYKLGSIWQLNCPEGYVPLSDVIQFQAFRTNATYPGKAIFDASVLSQLRCFREVLTESYVRYDNAGSGNDLDLSQLGFKIDMWTGAFWAWSTAREDLEDDDHSRTYYRLKTYKKVCNPRCKKCDAATGICLDFCGPHGCLGDDRFCNCDEDVFGPTCRFAEFGNPLTRSLGHDCCTQGSQCGEPNERLSQYERRCNDREIADRVCEIQSSCCDWEWSSDCVDIARRLSVCDPLPNPTELEPSSGSCGSGIVTVHGYNFVPFASDLVADLNPLCHWTELCELDNCNSFSPTTIDTPAQIVTEGTGVATSLKQSLVCARPAFPQRPLPTPGFSGQGRAWNLQISLGDYFVMAVGGGYNTFDKRFPPQNGLVYRCGSACAVSPGVETRCLSAKLNLKRYPDDTAHGFLNERIECPAGWVIDSIRPPTISTRQVGSCCKAGSATCTYRTASLYNATVDVCLGQQICDPFEILDTWWRSNNLFIDCEDYDGEGFPCFLNRRRFFEELACTTVSTVEWDQLKLEVTATCVPVCLDDLPHTVCTDAGVLEPVLPANDQCINAQSIPGVPTYNISGTTIYATSDPELFQTNVVTSPRSNGVWYTLQGTGDYVELDFCDQYRDFARVNAEAARGEGNEPDYDGWQVNVFQGPDCEPRNLKVVAGRHFLSIVDECSLPKTFAFPTIRGARYFVHVTTFLPTDFVFHALPSSLTAPDNTRCGEAPALFLSNPGAIAGDINGAEVFDFGDRLCLDHCSRYSCSQTRHTVWYRVNGNGRTLAVHLNSGQFDLRRPSDFFPQNKYDAEYALHVYTGACSNLVCVRGSSYIPHLVLSLSGDWLNSVEWDSVRGQNYYIAISAREGRLYDNGQFLLSVNSVRPPGCIDLVSEKFDGVYSRGSWPGWKSIDRLFGKVGFGGSGAALEPHFEEKRDLIHPKVLVGGRHLPEIVEAPVQRREEQQWQFAVRDRMDGMVAEFVPTDNLPQDVVLKTQFVFSHPLGSYVSFQMSFSLDWGNRNPGGEEGYRRRDSKDHRFEVVLRPIDAYMPSVIYSYYGDSCEDGSVIEVDEDITEILRFLPDGPIQLEVRFAVPEGDGGWVAVDWLRIADCNNAVTQVAQPVVMVDRVAEVAGLIPNSDATFVVG